MTWTEEIIAFVWWMTRAIVFIGVVTILVAGIEAYVRYLAA